MGECCSAVAQHHLEKILTRHYFNDDRDQGMMHSSVNSRKGRRNVSQVLLIEVFEVLDAVKAATFAVKFSFNCVIDAFLEYLLSMKLPFSSRGGLRLQKDFQILVDWASNFDNEHGTSCLDCDCLDRAHAAVVVLREPVESSARGHEFFICAEQLFDLEKWLGMRTEKVSSSCCGKKR